MNTSSLLYSVEGPAKAPALVFLHGWPDGPELWQKQVQYFSRQFRCLRITWPNFGKLRTNRGPQFSSLVELLKTTLDEALPEEPNQKVVLIGHDWGAYLSYLFESQYPERVHSLIALDVGARIQADHWYEALSYFAYQGWLISAWWLGKIWPQLGTSMSRAMARIAHSPAPEKVSYEMNFLYFQFWKNLLLKSTKQSLLRDYNPQCPVFFIYGRKKAIMFHSKRWEDYLKQRSDCLIVSLPDAGHWLMRDQPQAINRWIQEWLDETKFTPLSHSETISKSKESFQ